MFSAYRYLKRRFTEEPDSSTQSTATKQPRLEQFMTEPAAAVVDQDPSGEPPLLPLVAGLPELVKPVVEQSEKSTSTAKDETSTPSEEPAAGEASATSTLRTSGIKPSKLKTVGQLYEEDAFGEVEEEFYNFNEEINEKVILW